MENVYRIMLSDNINIAKGYINVSFNGSPVVKIEEVKEQSSEEEGIIEGGITEDEVIEEHSTTEDELEADVDIEPME